MAQELDRNSVLFFKVLFVKVDPAKRLTLHSQVQHFLRKSPTRDFFNCVKPTSSRVRSQISKALMLTLFLALFVSRAALVPVWGSSEAREAHVAELVAHGAEFVSGSFNSGAWILPLRNGFVPSKPPLLHWLGALLISLLGCTGLQAARFVSAAAGIATVAIAANYAASQTRIARANEIWWLTAGVLLSSYGFFSLASDARVDMLLCFLVTGAGITILSGLDRISDALPAGREEAVRSMQYRAATWIGLAVLAKGPLGLAFPGLFALVAIAFRKRSAMTPSLWPTLIPRLGPLILVLLIATPWYLAAIAQGGGSFLERQIFFENIARFTGGDGINSRPWYFYLPVFISTAFPWSVFVVFAAALSLHAPEKYFRTPISAVWFVGVLVLSLSDGKRASYLLVLLPWVGMHAAHIIERFFAATERAIFWDRILARSFEMLGLMSIVFAGIAIGQRRFSSSRLWELGYANVSPALVLGASCVVGWLVCVTLIFRAVGKTSPLQSIGVQICALAGFAVCIASTGLAVKAAIKGYDRTASRIAERVATAPLYAVRTRFDERLDPILYLLRQPVAILDPSTKRASLPDKGFILADKSWLLTRGFINESFLEQFPQPNSELALVAGGSVGIEP